MADAIRGQEVAPEATQEKPAERAGTPVKKTKDATSRQVVGTLGSAFGNLSLLGKSSD